MLNAPRLSAASDRLLHELGSRGSDVMAKLEELGCDKRTLLNAVAFGEGIFRYFADRSNGKSVERNYVLATVRECPTEAKAWKQLGNLDLQTQINKPSYLGPNANLTVAHIKHSQDPAS